MFGPLRERIQMAVERVEGMVVGFTSFTRWVCFVLLS